MALSDSTSASSEYHVYPTPTQAAYMMSEAVINIIVGGMGEGKTFSSILAIFAHSQRNREMLKNGRLECAIVRDTHENIKHSIVPTFNEFFTKYPDLIYRWRNDFKDLWIDSNPAIHCSLFGVDDEISLTKLQGPEFGLIWLEEVAPYTDTHRTNAGIREDTFNAALARCARQQSVKARLQMSSNPPDEDHWFYQRLLSTPDGPLHPKTPLITKKVFNIPVGENVYLKEESRQATFAAYMHDEAAFRRFVLGEYATKYPGKKVAENFNSELHVSKEPLDPVDGLTGWIGYDSWGDSVAVMGQQWPDGRIWVLDVCALSNDIRGLIQDEIKPRLELPRWKDKCRSWRHIGDCTMINRDQSSAETRTSTIIEEAFKDENGHNAVFEPGPSTWHFIKNGLLQSLRWTIHGQPAVLIDPVHCKSLISGLKGQWHYAKNRGGVVQRNQPVKNEACVDAGTEILTLSGWKRYDTVEIGDPIYSYDLKNQALTLDIVRDVHIYGEDPLGYEVLRYRGHGIEMVVTPEHNCVARRRITVQKDGKTVERISPFELVRAENLHTGHQLLRAASSDPRLSNRLRGPKDREISDDFVKLCAWVMTEGTYTATGGIVITQSRSHNPQYVSEINDLMAQFPGAIFSKADIPPGKGGASAVWAIRYEIEMLIRQLMPNKYPSPEFVQMLTTAQKRLFLYEAIKGDGDFGPNQQPKSRISRNRDFWPGNPSHTPRIACGSLQEAQSIQTIATLVGLQSSINPPKPISLRWKVSLHRSFPHTQIVKLEVQKGNEPLVWCPTTGNHTWIARRNNAVFITGNSHKCDALANALCKLSAWDPPKRYNKRQAQQRNQRSRRRAASYAS